MARHPDSDSARAVESTPQPGLDCMIPRYARPMKSTARRRFVRLVTALAALAIALCGMPAGIADEREVLEKILISGRLDTVGLRSSDRLKPIARLAPGDPPLLAFRYLEDRRRHRFGKLDLMMDDAGH